MKTEKRRSCLITSLLNDPHDLRALLSSHQWHPLFYYPRLFPRNLLQSISEKLTMINPYTGNDTNFRLKDVRCIQSATHTDLNHCPFHLHSHEMQKGHRAHYLKKSGAEIFNPGHNLPDLVSEFHDSVFRYLLSVDPYPF